MIIPVRCFTCNKVLADKYDYFLMKKNANEQSSKVNNVVENNQEILDNMGIERYCCRRHMITTLDMMEII